MPAVLLAWRPLPSMREVWVGWTLCRLGTIAQTTAQPTPTER